MKQLYVEDVRISVKLYEGTWCLAEYHCSFWSRVQFSSTWWLCCSPVPSFHYVEASVNAVSVVLVKYTDIVRLPMRYVGVTKCPDAEYIVYESSS